jgi:hypothetical protein
MIYIAAECFACSLAASALFMELFKVVMWDIIKIR